MKKDDPRFAWSWDMRPATVEEFDRMMVSIDRHLAGLSLEPNQRALNAALIISSKLGLSGTPLFGGDGDRGEPFSPADILARIHEWYSETYGDKALIDFSPGSVVLPLHGNLWELKMPRVWGRITVFLDRNLANKGNLKPGGRGAPPPSMNVLLSIVGMTPAYASKLTDADLAQINARFQGSFGAISCLEDLAGHGLFEEARGDYRHSVDALLTGREFSKTRWDTAQCAEKVFKGLLARDGHAFPTSGPNGHNIVHLGGLVKEKLGIACAGPDLEAVQCSPKVRYGEVPSTKEDALGAHEALGRILRVLSVAKAHHAHRT